MDRYLLEYELKRNEKTRRNLADYLGINITTLYRKITGESDFTRSEIQKTKDYLDLTSEQLEHIFFEK